MPSRATSPSSFDTDVVGARAGAQVVDNVLSFAVFFLVAALLNDAGLPTYEAVLLSLAVPFTYSAVLEAVWDGQTIGKWAFGIQVRSDSGNPVRPIQAFVRNLPAVASPFQGPYVVALLSIATTDDRQRVFDQVADTVVVRRY